MAGRESFKQKEWAKVDFYVLVLTGAAKLLGSDCHLRCRELLKRLDAEDIYIASEQKIEAMFAGMNLEGLNARYAEEGIAAPFSDYGPARVTSWKQLGINWQVQWNTAYESEKFGEAFCAVLQIVFAALAGTELSVIAADVSILLNTAHSGELRIEQNPDNDTLRFSVSIDPSVQMSVGEQLAVAYYVLAASSAIPTEDFKNRFEEEFKRGLPAKIGVYVSPHEAFRQFYLETEYVDLHQADPAKAVQKVQAVRTSPEISGTTDIHPQFVESEALDLIRKRYERSVKLIPRTRLQLASDPAFRDLVSKLTNAGWKDWHILMSVVNVRMSSLGNANSSNSAEVVRRFSENGESPELPLTPASFYGEEEMRMCLRMSQIDTLRKLGFRVDQLTPNFQGIDAFLARFKYWELDVPHSNPFPSAESQSDPRSSE